MLSKMNNESWFEHYWGSAILALPFVVRISFYVNDTVHSKNLFFMAYVILGLLIFPLETKAMQTLKYILSGLFFYSFFNQYDALSPWVVYQFVCFGAGLLLLLSVASNARYNKRYVFYRYMMMANLLQCVWIAF